MCGIAGLFAREAHAQVDRDLLVRMRDRMVHRGPDGAGLWCDDGIGLAHRRLSVIDVEGSPQPMHSPDGRAAIVFNGEIYNYRALRSELAGLGHAFRTEGDTEVILAAWRQWGADCVARFDGMFAFALYDRERRQLFLARDRFGVKPLFTALLPDGTFAFASELKGLLAHPALDRTIDPLAIEDYFAWGYVPDHRSMLAGVDKLPAGHYRIVEHGKPPHQPVCWYDISFEQRETMSAVDEAEALRAQLGTAVASRMVSDVPIGAFLSGGVDSSAVVALMADRASQAVTTCSIGFDVADLDETAHARLIAEQFGTAHHERIVDPAMFDRIDALAGMFDEPFADASALPTAAVCALAREHVTVALSGDGADEAFAGYRRHVFHAAEERARGALPLSLRRAVFGPLAALYPKADWAPRPFRAKTTLQSLALSGEEAYARALGVMSPKLRERIFSPAMKRELGGYRAEQPLIELMRNAPVRSGLDRAQYADLKFWLPGDILTKVDRTSMAVSLEAREPLLDHHLVELATRLPETRRVSGGQGKLALKQAMEGTLPRQILYRPKQGFVLPIAQWFRSDLKEAARAAARSERLLDTGWFDAAALSQLAEDHIAGRRDHARELWQLLMLERSVSLLSNN
ncbi:asparagine synthase [Citromicrobium sp. RCC1885]|uniref:XrtA/PEP-CTERM system amidotransferase n=1 Tax=unclassified Citromicrobium TaxID=2630544 RepID=UPI0006C8EBF6|nr:MULTISPECIES: XrtA/PEP-CTERM system amidotransferase [unclassified Citromicrobium]KPM25322.1 asparagine synthase [Citromicrobium sp. RCC1885]KPM28563.1 asparagine synthase [Citromicrobium sp. RCC1878]OAM09897.1 asparagine synthetase B [Citromicrobium sp. RCC1897]|tara:strand:- start:1622 stop:3517 length:1896 start_codon:yes stop_codon:yes gene_type:complete